MILHPYIILVGVTSSNHSGMSTEEDRCALLQENQSEVDPHREGIEGDTSTTSFSPEPLVGRRWSQVPSTWTKFSKWTRDIRKKPGLQLVGVALVIILAALIGLVIGLLIGHNLYHGENRCSNSGSEATPTPSSNVPLHNWGSAVAIGGQSMEVTEVFSSEIKAEDIRNYLM